MSLVDANENVYQGMHHICDKLVPWGFVQLLQLLILQAGAKVTTLHCLDDKYGIKFWLEKDGKNVCTLSCFIIVWTKMAIL